MQSNGSSGAMRHPRAPFCHKNGTDGMVCGMVWGMMGMMMWGVMRVMTRMMTWVFVEQ